MLRSGVILPKQSNGARGSSSVVECHLAKVDVASSNLVYRSIANGLPDGRFRPLTKQSTVFFYAKRQEKAKQRRIMFLCQKIKKSLSFLEKAPLAGAEGFEPSTKVLETHVLPLHHAPWQCSDYTAYARGCQHDVLNAHNLKSRFLWAGFILVINSLEGGAAALRLLFRAQRPVHWARLPCAARLSLSHLSPRRAAGEYANGAFPPQKL